MKSLADDGCLSRKVPMKKRVKQDEKKIKEVYDKYGWTEAKRDDPIYSEPMTVVFNPPASRTEKTEGKTVTQPRQP